MTKGGNKGFKRIELVVIMTVLALLAVVSIPAIQNSMLLSDFSECGQRGRDIYVALIGANAGKEAQAVTGLTTGKNPTPDGRFKNSTDFFRYQIEHQHLPDLTYKSLAGCGVPVCKDGNLKPENNMWTMIKDWQYEMEDIIPVMLSRNLDASSFSFKGEGEDKPIRFDPEWKTPFGKKGCVIIRKGGAIFMARNKYVTTRIVFGGGPADPGPVCYLTPSREVVVRE